MLNQYPSNLFRSTWFDCSWRALTFSRDTISVLQCHGEMIVCFANSIQESLNVRLNTQKRAQRDVLNRLHDDHRVWKALKISHPIKTKGSLCHKRCDLMKHYRNITPIEMTYHKKKHSVNSVIISRRIIIKGFHIAWCMSVFTALSTMRNSSSDGSSQWQDVTFVRFDKSPGGRISDLRITQSPDPNHWFSLGIAYSPTAGHK